jgi:hypothetical protein
MHELPRTFVLILLEFVATLVDARTLYVLFLLVLQLFLATSLLFQAESLHLRTSTQHNRIDPTLAKVALRPQGL